MSFSSRPRLCSLMLHGLAPGSRMSRNTEATSSPSLVMTFQPPAFVWNTQNSPSSPPGARARHSRLAKRSGLGTKAWPSTARGRRRFVRISPARVAGSGDARLGLAVGAHAVEIAARHAVQSKAVEQRRKRLLFVDRHAAGQIFFYLVADLAGLRARSRPNLVKPRKSFGLDESCTSSASTWPLPLRSDQMNFMRSSCGPPSLATISGDLSGSKPVAMPMAAASTRWSCS